MTTVDRFLHSVLTHPLAMSLKRPLKDLWWWASGWRFANPSIPARIDSILFVCHGNICRSPFAADLAAKLLRGEGHRHVRCASAGIRTNPASRPPSEAIEAAAVFGASFDNHQPLQVSDDVIAAFDLVVVMEAAHAAELRRRYPQAAKRIVLLSLLDDSASGSYARYNIADPFGQPFATFVDCYRRIKRALTNLVTRLEVEEYQAAASGGRRS
ncbi:MAG TPA: hypothetical protein VH740_00885 [Vicinamibacterales bacterium]|jgi:protein-tyrosine phosphatase